jgi:hypothetical protein
MAIDRQYIEQGWLDGAIRHLDLLYKESQKYEDEGDILATDKGMRSAKELMSQIAKSSPPRIAITVNGEILFTWDTPKDDLTACVATDGKIKFCIDHAPVDRNIFVRYLSTTIAA